MNVSAKIEFNNKTDALILMVPKSFDWIDKTMNESD